MKRICNSRNIGGNFKFLNNVQEGKKTDVWRIFQPVLFFTAFFTILNTLKVQGILKFK